MPRIAIIDNAMNPDVYRPVRHWSRWLTRDWASFDARKGRLPSLDDGFSHIILTGSEASILERPLWAEAEVALVRNALARGFPILGSCYGNQLLALAIGGPHISGGVRSRKSAGSTSGSWGTTPCLARPGPRTRSPFISTKSLTRTDS